jgi:hypothetical protein
MKEYDPAGSYSSCYVRVSDVDGLYKQFTDGLRQKFGRVPSAGVSRFIPLKNKAGVGIPLSDCVSPPPQRTAQSTPRKKTPTHRSCRFVIFTYRHERRFFTTLSLCDVLKSSKLSPSTFVLLSLTPHPCPLQFRAPEKTSGQCERSKAEAGVRV